MDQKQYISNLSTLYTILDDISIYVDKAKSDEKKQAVHLNLGQIKENLLKELRKDETFNFVQLEEKKQETELKKDETSKKETSNVTQLEDNTQKNANLQKKSDNNIQYLSTSHLDILSMYIEEIKFVSFNLLETKDDNEKSAYMLRLSNILGEINFATNLVILPNNIVKKIKDFVNTITKTVTISRNKTTPNNISDRIKDIDKILQEINQQQEELQKKLHANEAVKNLYDQQLEHLNTNEKQYPFITFLLNINYDLHKPQQEELKKYQNLCQQEYKLRTIKQNPTKYIGDIEQITAQIKDKRTAIIPLKQKIIEYEQQKSSIENKKPWIPSWIPYLTNKAKKIEHIDQNISALQQQVESYNTSRKELVEKRSESFTLETAIKTNSLDKLKELIPDVSNSNLLQQLNLIKSKQIGPSDQNIIEKKPTSWVKRIKNKFLKSKDNTIS